MFDKDNKFGFINNNESNNNNVEGLDKVKSDLNNIKSDVDELNTQYKDIVKDTSVKTDAKIKKCMVSFTDDDCRKEVYTILKPIADEKNVKFTLAMPTAKIGTSNYLSAEQVKDLYQQGWEFMWHTHSENNMNTMTTEEMEAEYNESYKCWSDLGIPVNNIIAYPQGRDTDLVRNFSSGKFKMGVDTFRTKLNTVPYAQYSMSRYEIGTSHKEDYKTKLGSPYNTNTIEHYKWLVDKAVEENAWLIFYTHAWYPTFDSTQQEYLKEVIDYVRSKDIEIVTLEEGLKRTGNLINIGDYNGTEQSGDYFVVGCDGSIKSSFLEKIVPILNYSEGQDYSTKSISEFENGITITAVSSSDATNMPMSRPGTLFTVKPNKYQGYCYQKYFIYETGIEYTRGCNTKGAWQNWISSSYLLAGGSNEEPSTIPISKYKTGTTLQYVDSSTCSNMPENVPGTLITVKPCDYTGYAYQEYILYQGGIKYIRSCDNSGNWLGWNTTTININTESADPANKSINDYRLGISVSFVGNSIATLMPESKAGTLTTYKLNSTYLGYCYQEYVIYEEGTKYIRSCKRTGVWEAWKKCN